MELITIRKWIGSFITLLLFTLVTSSCGENSDSETIRKLQTQVDTLSNELAEANSTTTPTETTSTTTPTETTPTTTPTETTSESVKTITEDSEINLDEVVIDTEVGRVLNSSDWRTYGEFPWTDLSWSEPGELIAGDSSACELKNVGSVLVTGISPGTCFVKIGATEIVSREPFEKGETEHRVFQINVNLGPGVPEIVPDAVFDIKVGKVLFYMDWKQHFSSVHRGWPMPVIVAGDSSACELSNVEGPHVTGMSSGTCFVKITSQQRNPDTMERIGGPEHRIFQINVTPRTENAQQPLPVTTLNDESTQESTRATADSCIEAFVFEQSSQPSDQSAVADYTFFPDDPDSTLRLSILPCSAIPYLASTPGRSGFSLSVNLIPDTIPDSHSTSDFELIWIDYLGDFNIQEHFDDYGIAEQNSYVGHPFFIRYKTPQPEIKVVENCDSDEVRKPYTFYQQAIEGWVLHFECVMDYIPDQIPSLINVFTNDFQDINSVLPKQALTLLQEKTDFFIVFSREAKSGQKMKTWKAAASFRNPYARIIGAPNEYGGAIIVDSQQWDFEGEWKRSLMLHELAHAWHCMNWTNAVINTSLLNPQPSRDASGCFVGDTQIEEAYEAALSAGIYEAVYRVGELLPVEAYANTNKQEYFAELTEAWFLENDYYPQNREELLEHDPLGAAAIEAAWNSSP